MGIKELSGGWSFTEIRGGEGTKDGEWLSIEQVATAVHVELLEAERIPDPVSRFYSQRPTRVALTDITIYQSSSGYMNGMCSEIDQLEEPPSHLCIVHGPELLEHFKSV